MFHPATVKDGILYIDGGLETFANITKNGNFNGTIVNGYSKEATPPTLACMANMHSKIRH